MIHKALKCAQLNRESEGHFEFPKWNSVSEFESLAKRDSQFLDASKNCATSKGMHTETSFSKPFQTICLLGCVHLSDTSDAHVCFGAREKVAASLISKCTPFKKVYHSI